MLDLAIQYAKRNNIKGLPRMAAVLFVPSVGSNVCFIGFNQYKTHPLQAKFGKSDKHIHLHAEIDVIRKALSQKVSSYDLIGAEMYIARVYADGNPALAKPCIGCQRALIHFNIGEVQWTK